MLSAAIGIIYGGFRYEHKRSCICLCNHFTSSTSGDVCLGVLQNSEESTTTTKMSQHFQLSVRPKSV